MRGIYRRQWRPQVNHRRRAFPYGVSAVPNTITLTDYTTGRIFQRNGTTGKITVAGTYTGTPTAIQARIVNDGTSTEVVTWTTIDAAPAGGGFSGTLASIPQGGWYNVQVRFGNDTGVVSNGTSKIGVGSLFVVAGQSQGVRWFTEGTTHSANSLVRKYSGSAGSGWATLGTGNGATNCANLVRTELTWPVGMLNYAVGSTALDTAGDAGAGYWMNTAGGSPYALAKAGWDSIKVAGEPMLEGVIWLQGEQDAYSNAVSEATYQSDLETLLARFRTDTGQAALPAFICGLATYTTNSTPTDASWQGIQNALKTVAGQANNYYAATSQDLALADGVHLSSASFSTQGARVAQSINDVLGSATYSRGPAISSAQLINATTIDVTLAHRGGSDFTPTSGITGFTVLDDSTPVTVLTAARQSASVVRLGLAASITGTVTVRYLYGRAPTVSAPLKDNSGLTLPLENAGGISILKTATVTLVNESGSAQTGLSSLKWAWFDEVTPDLFNAPTDQGAAESTDGSGVLTASLLNSTKPRGQIGWLIVTNSDGTVSATHRSFAGPVAVD